MRRTKRTAISCEQADARCAGCAGGAGGAGGGDNSQRSGSSPGNILLEDVDQRGNTTPCEDGA